jgi:RNA polymerase sigma-70 factor (ECF subfamily)
VLLVNQTAGLGDLPQGVTGRHLGSRLLDVLACVSLVDRMGARRDTLVRPAVPTAHRALNMVRTTADEIEMELEPFTDDNSSRAVFERTLAAAQSGDARAFEVLYESLNRRLRSFVALRGAADPDGTVNDVFLKVFTNMNGFVGNEQQFQAWIFTIARNTVIDEARRRARRLDETPLGEAHEALMVGGDSEIEAAARLTDSWLLDQLDVLTPDQRDVVVLRVVSDLTIDAIAQVLGKEVGAVKAMQRRAFRKLAKQLESKAVPK